METRPGYKLTSVELARLQNLSLEEKIVESKRLIKEYYGIFDGKVYVAFSGGKDSCVLLDMVRQLYPDVVGVFSNTGLEYPEIVSFVKTIPNIITLRPKMTFKEVLSEHGYPIISKKVARAIKELKNPTEKNQNLRRLYTEGVNRHGIPSPNWKLAKKHRYLVNAPFKISDKCCDYLKKEPFNRYEKKEGRNKIMGLMAVDSDYRKSSILKYGFMAIDKKKTTYCIPMAFWKREDVLGYISKYNLPYCKELYGEIILEDGKYYNTGIHGTGCIFCMFGVHLEEQPNRFQLMKKTHPALYKYCMEELKLKEILEYINVPFE